VACALACATTAAHAQLNVKPKEIQGLELVERLGEQIPLELSFAASTGDDVRLGSYFDDGRPVVLALVYYRCPVVCTLVMQRMVETFAEMDFSIGQDFNVVYLSIDDSEGPTAARTKQIELLGQYGRGGGASIEENWGFLTGDAISVRQVADAVGFDYRKLPNGEYSHPVVFMVLSPDGRVMRYMYGYDQPPRQMKLALLDASEGKIARSLMDRVLHFCYQFDPDAGAYTIQAMQLMRLGGLLTMVLLIGLIGGLFVYERRRRAAARRRDESGLNGMPGGTGLAAMGQGS
jgi:protein SCO1/2